MFIGVILISNKSKSYISLGIVMGAAIGRALDDMIIGVGVGIVFGISIGAIRNSKKSNKNNMFKRNHVYFGLCKFN